MGANSQPAFGCRDANLGQAMMKGHWLRRKPACADGRQAGISA